MLSREALYGSGVPATAKPGSSTPTTDLIPSIPPATAVHYNPDATYDTSADKTTVSKEKHRWFVVRDIGVVTRSGGSNAISVASPLTIVAGQQVIDFAENPEYVAIGILASNGANAQLLIWLGDGGGHPMRIGNGGQRTIPMNGETRIVIQAIGQSIVGTMIGFAGYDPAVFSAPIPASQP